MSKREEIREWYRDILSGYGCPDTYLENETDKLFKYLHSQDVVIKGEEHNIYIGYYLIEPLIKEG